MIRDDQGAEPLGSSLRDLERLAEDIASLSKACTEAQDAAQVSRGDPDETVAAIRMRLCGRDGSEIVAARQAMQAAFGVDRRSATNGVSS
jgi:hypothetical protein